MVQAAVVAKSVVVIKVLAACLAGPADFADFVKYIETELGRGSVKTGAKVVLPQPVTILGPSTYSDVAEFRTLEISEQALLDKLAKDLADAKANPAKYQYSPPPTNVRALLEDFQFATAGGCEILAPTRLNLVRP